MKAFCWAGLALASPAAAQDTIVVTGRPLPDAIGDAAYDIVEIDRERLNGSASGRVEDVLKDVAGLAQFRRSDARSANPTSQGVTLRGLGGNASSRALVLLDGVPQSDPFGGWIPWPAFQPERLANIRVTRGGGSGAGGPGALAGTIELQSALLPEGDGLAYGSRDAFDADATVSARLGGGSGWLSADYARGDGFVPIVREDRGPADRPAPYEQASLAARAAVPIAPDTELQVSLLGFTDRRERGFAFSQNSTDGGDASVRLVGRGRWGFSALGYVQVREFRSSFASLDDERSVATQVADQYNVPSTGLGARFELRPLVREGRELRLGGDFRRVSGVTREFFNYQSGRPTRAREAGGESRTLGAFAEASARLGALTLTGGARIDHWRIADGFLDERLLAGGVLMDSDFADRSGWEPTGRAGIAYVAGDITLRGAVYRGWRLPTLNELYRPFRVGADATAANPALAPERLDGVEVGIDWRPRSGTRLAVTAFANRLDGAIANVTLANGPGVFPGVGFVSAAGQFRQRRNLDAVRAVGIELDGSLDLGDFALTGSYAYADSKVRALDAAAPLDRLRPAQTPRHSASATIGWKSASLTARYVSAQFEDDLNTLALDDALTLDARAALPLTKRLQLELRAENLADARVEAARSDNGVIERATPRTIWIGLRLGGD